MNLEHHTARNGEIELHCVSCGEGPLVVMCHGYPGLWYSWRHQLPAIAAAGYRAVAMDMRGYGRSSRPADRDAYGFDSTSADVLAVLDHFGAETAVVFGHDFGANLAWHLGIHHGDRITAIAPLCSPYDMAMAGGAEVLPSTLFASIAEQHFFHMHYYQFPDKPEAATRGREREFLERLFWALSARGELLSWENFPMEGTDYIDVLAPPADPLPWSWLSKEDMDYYEQEYLVADPGLTFAGGINSYRAMDRNWQQFRGTAHARVPVPALFVAGEEDPVVKLSSAETFDTMRRLVPDLRGCELLPGAGHFIQQEAPEALNSLLVEFLRGL